MKSIKKSTFLFFLVMAICSIPLYSQESSLKPRIAVKKLNVADPENIQLQVISDRVTDSTELVLKFMNEYELAPIDFSDTSESEAELLDICSKNNIDNIVFGKTYTGRDNSFVIEMSVYSREKEQTAFTQTGTAETALDIFEASDKLTASIIEEFSGIHIAFGKIHITNTGVPGSYLPFVDGEPFLKDAARIDNLLIGKRTVEIKQIRMLGETVIHTQDVIVRENSTSDISFEIPHLLPAESEVIADQDKIIDKNRDKRKRKEKVTKAFNQIDTILSDTPWNTSLTELREEYRKKRAEYEADYAELMKTGTREFIVGASMGINMVTTQEDMYDNEDNSGYYDPIDDEAWNDDKQLSPEFGINIQYQLFRNLYLQAEFNYKELFFSEYENMDNFVRITEIPLLFKFTEKFGPHRISIFSGPSFVMITEGKGIFEDSYSSGDFTRLDTAENTIGMVLGLEYGFQKGRHLLSAGLRYSNIRVLDYSYYDPDKNEDIDVGLRASVLELVLGYGYNLGGSGNIVKEEDENKWLLAADLGFMIMLGMDDNNTVPIAGAGFLRKITKNYYAGIRMFGFYQGGAPMLSVAYTKDPDEIIHNLSLSIFPMMDFVVGAFQYNLGFKRYSFGILGGGPLRDIEDLGIGFSLGYFY